MTDTNEKQASSAQEVVTAKRSSVDEKASISQHDVEGYDQDAEFGGPEARKKLERKLLLKVDARMSIMVLIYILNYVRPPLTPLLSVQLRLSPLVPLI